MVHEVFSSCCATPFANGTSDPLRRWPPLPFKSAADSPSQREWSTPLLFPPHTAHILNVAVYGPVKKAWKHVLKEFKIKRIGANVTKEQFHTIKPSIYHLYSIIRT